MSDFTIEQLEALKEGTTEGPWITYTGSFGRIYSVGPIEQGFSGSGLECDQEDADLATAAPDLVDALIAEKRAHQKLRDEMGELVEYLSIQEGKDRPSRLYVHGQHSAMELIKDILEGE